MKLRALNLRDRNSKMIEKMMLMLFLIGFCSAESNFTHHIYLDPHEKYEMWWKFDSKEITVKLRVGFYSISPSDKTQMQGGSLPPANNTNQVETLGWIGWGISPNGQMDASDIVLAWFDKGKPNLQDSHAITKTTPVADNHQDYNLIEMKRLEGNTTVVFKRKLILCNAEDMSITSDTIRLIWSYGDSDTPQYHGNKRNTHSVLLVDYADKGDQTTLPKDTIVRELRMNSSYVLEKKKTLYKCVPFKAWNLTQRHHLIRVEPVIQQGHENLLHHILLYDCRGTKNESTLNKQHDCDNPNMPDHIKTCREVVIHAWAIGGTAMNYPKVAGLSFGGPNDPNYFLMEVHYDNPGLLENIRDSSGLRFFLTPTLRDFDAAIFTFGAAVGPNQIIIPQGQSSFTWRGFCSSKCFNITADRKIKPQVFASFLHSHLAGRKLIARLVRDSDGVETKRIAQDLNYDFNFQEVKTFSEPLELPPDHSLYLDCVYNTESTTKPTVGGYSTKDEMCLGFLWYYPAYENGWCASTNMPTFGEFQSKEMKWKIDSTGKISQPLTIAGNNYTGEAAWKALQEPSIWTKDLVKKWQEYQKLPLYKQVCRGKERKEEVLTPKLTKTLPDDKCVGKGVSNSNFLRVSIFNILAVITIIVFI